jgi:hypothetical protein
LLQPRSGPPNGVAANALTGTFTITRFAIQNGQLVAIGTGAINTQLLNLLNQLLGVLAGSEQTRCSGSSGTPEH